VAVGGGGSITIETDGLVVVDVTAIGVHTAVTPTGWREEEGGKGG